MCSFCYETRTWPGAGDFGLVCLHVGIPLMMILKTTFSSCSRCSNSIECVFLPNFSCFAIVRADLTS